MLFDTFGNAVAGRDVAGSISYKVYDKTGALKYEVDAEGYVTEYDRNAMGDVTLRLRYAVKTGLTANGYKGISAEAVAAAVNAAGLDHGGDRGEVTAYDKLGRAVEVSQSQIYAYDSSAAVGRSTSPATSWCAPNMMPSVRRWRFANWSIPSRRSGRTRPSTTIASATWSRGSMPWVMSRSRPMTGWATRPPCAITPRPPLSGTRRATRCRWRTPTTAW
ncbi:hypothetical protein WJ970_09575 [Achromobacter xylosoxidans]